MHSEWVGRELGEYFVFERIGAGSMAEVYKALQPSMDRLVGIKILSPALSHDAQFVARFKREVQIVASLEHPHILPVIDFGEREGTFYLVMRYVGGGTLHDLIEQGPLEPPLALRYLSEIGEALDYAHQQRVVHRDIKPRNVLLDQQGRPLPGRFRPGPAYRRRQYHPQRGGDDRHPALHEPRAGARPAGGWPQRPVCPGRDALPDAHRPRAV